MTQQHQDQIIINISPDIAEALEGVLKEHLEMNIEYLTDPEDSPNFIPDPDRAEILDQNLACEEVLEQLSQYIKPMSDS